MQLVVISNRPALLAETLEYWDHLVPWIDEALVVCPTSEIEQMASTGRIRLQAVDEGAILGSASAQFTTSSDHQFKNLLLRRAIAHAPQVNPEFLMADDDARPLAPIFEDLFLRRGRHCGFYFHQLEHWPAHETDFDRGQHHSAALLAKHRLSTLSFASHMPQIMHKELLAEVFGSYAEELEEGRPLDEWSLYFNTARALHPEHFVDPEPYRTLCWPALPTDWNRAVMPPEYLFENFHIQLYDDGRLFAAIPTRFDSVRAEHWAAERIRRRQAAQRRHDSVLERLLRRLGWVLHRAARAGQHTLCRSPRAERLLSRLAPEGLASVLVRAAEQGHDPAFWRRYG